ncbi:carboxymuconolactone decarboxylase family protein [Longispora sp. K20-0274]|uniref:carboxymuconolactone decarboxylase family protein n=1 Tax=Longispora sp. K20-0274 TaxID=3088255 RepID=UPI00399AEFEA
MHSRSLGIPQLAPEGYRKLIELSAYTKAHLDPTLVELVLLRASVVNGCAFCVDMHTRDALKNGEDARRLFAVSAWRESSWFTAEERAALALTDAVTRLGEDGVPDDVWAAATELFTDKQVADLLLAIVTINSFNRLMVAVRKQPPPL